MQQFKGASFHTAQWDYGVDLKGKHVGFIGTGASAAQVITSIADEVETLTVFQRPPHGRCLEIDEPTPPEIVEAFRRAVTAKVCDMLIGKTARLGTANCHSTSTCCTIRRRTTKSVRLS